MLLRLHCQEKYVSFYKFNLNFDAICHLFLNQSSYPKRWTWFCSCLLLEILLQFIQYEQHIKMQLI